MTTASVLKSASLSIAGLLELSPWFVSLDEEARRRVASDMREVQVPAGSALCRENDIPLYWYGTLEGILKWSVTSSDGRSISFGGFSVGSWHGEGALLRGLPRAADIVALRASRVAVMPRETFEWLHRTQQSFDHFLLKQITERLYWFMGNYEAHRLLGTDRQVARALVGLFHPPLHSGDNTLLQFTQEEIANLCGISRQRCNVALNRLKSDGFIRTEYGGVTVINLDGLRRFIEKNSEPDRPALKRKRR